MAEIGLVASVFSIASFGASISKALYDFGYTMRRAHRQIDDIAGEVTTFTKIIRELGKVLEAQKELYTENAVKMVEESMFDCKKIFRMIKRQIRRKKEKAVPIEWLFRKKRADELVKRMEALKGKLGLTLQIVQITRKMETDAKIPDALAGLREEIEMLKNEVLAYHRSLPRLQKAEKTLQVATQPYLPRHKRHLPRYLPRQPSLGRHRRLGKNPSLPRNPFTPNHPYLPQRPEQPWHQSAPAARGRSSSILSKTYSEDDLDQSVATMELSDSRPISPTLNERNKSPPSPDLYDVDLTDDDKSVRSLDSDQYSYQPDAESRQGPLSHREHRPTSTVSKRLIASMPYNPLQPLGSAAGPSRRIGSRQAKDSDTEATAALKILFSKWTKADPQVVKDLLNKKSDESSRKPTVDANKLHDSEDDSSLDELFSDSETEEDEDYDEPIEIRPRPPTDPWAPRPFASMPRPQYQPPPPPQNNFGPPPQNNFGPHPQNFGHPPFFNPEPGLGRGWGTQGMSSYGLPITRRAWCMPQVEENPLAKVLAMHNARFVWMQRSKDELIYWVDNQRCVRYELNPPLHEFGPSRRFETVLPKQWVLREALELFSYPFTESAETNFTIPRELNYIQVRQLVEISSHKIEANIRAEARESMGFGRADPNDHFPPPRAEYRPPVFYARDVDRPTISEIDRAGPLVRFSPKQASSKSSVDLTPPESSSRQAVAVTDTEDDEILVDKKKGVRQATASRHTVQDQKIALGEDSPAKASDIGITGPVRKVNSNQRSRDDRPSFSSRPRDNDTDDDRQRRNHRRH